MNEPTVCTQCCDTHLGVMHVVTKLDVDNGDAYHHALSSVVRDEDGTNVALSLIAIAPFGLIDGPHLSRFRSVRRVYVYDIDGPKGYLSREVTNDYELRLLDAEGETWAHSTRFMPVRHDGPGVDTEREPRSA